MVYRHLLPFIGSVISAVGISMCQGWVSNDGNFVIVNISRCSTWSPTLSHSRKEKHLKEHGDRHHEMRKWNRILGNQFYSSSLLGIIEHENFSSLTWFCQFNFGTQGMPYYIIKKSPFIPLYDTI